MKEAYPVYIKIGNDGCIINIPDYGVCETVATVRSLASAMGYARNLIEDKIKNGDEIKDPGSAEYKKSKNDIMTYVDVEFQSEKEKMAEEDYDKLHRETAWNDHENVIEFFYNDKIMSLTLTRKKFVNKVRKLAEQHPDDVKILYENEDGSIFAKMPVKYLRLNAPHSSRVYTEEERAIMRERLSEMRKRKNN